MRHKSWAPGHLGVKIVYGGLIFSAQFCNFQAHYVHPEARTMPPSVINQTVITQAETIKYLGLHFDKRLTWKNHITTKRKQLEHKTREISWLIGKHSPLSLENKLLIYKTVIKPVWTYA